MLTFNEKSLAFTSVTRSSPWHWCWCLRL